MVGWGDGTHKLYHSCLLGRRGGWCSADTLAEVPDWLCWYICTTLNSPFLKAAAMWLIRGQVSAIAATHCLLLVAPRTIQRSKNHTCTAFICIHISHPSRPCVGNKLLLCIAALWWWLHSAENMFLLRKLACTQSIRLILPESFLQTLHLIAPGT